MHACEADKENVQDGYLYGFRSHRLRIHPPLWFQHWLDDVAGFAAIGIQIFNYDLRVTHLRAKRDLHWVIFCLYIKP